MKKKWVTKDNTWFNNSLNCTAVKLLQNLVELSMNDFKSIYKKSISFVFILFCCNAINAQTNLVPNPSFEQYTNCPINNSLTAILNNKPDIWYKPNQRSAIYFNICSNNQPNDGIPYNGFGGGISYQYPRTGVAYMAMGYVNSNFNDYVQIQLFDSLKLNKRYYCEYFVSLCNANDKGCNNIGMLFTNNVVYADTINKSLLLANPQIVSYGNPIVTDTMGWVKVSGIFTAKGGEQYLTLGNFKTKANTQTQTIQMGVYNGAGYYVDDVAVYALDSFCLKADAGKDITIQQGDSAFIGSYTNGIDSLMWLENGTTPKDSTRPGFYVHPSSSTFYVLQQTVNGCFSSDTVYINVLLPLKFISYNIVSSLRVTKQSVENTWSTANEINVSHFNIQRSSNGNNFKIIGKVKAQNKLTNEYSFTDETPNEGLNYYRIESVDFDGRKQYTETRIINLKPQTLNGVSIYPNPAKDYLNISSQENIKEIKIINQIGRVLEHQTPNSKQITINTKQLIKGVYIVQCTTNKGEISTQKLFVAN